MVDRHSLPRTLILFALAIIVSSLSPQTAAAQRGENGIVILSNTQWDSVRVELRVGASTDCSTNPPLDVLTLRRNQRWAVVTDELICWRREQVPGDTSAGWTVWGQTRTQVDEVRDVIL